MRMPIFCLNFSGAPLTPDMLRMLVVLAQKLYQGEMLWSEFETSDFIGVVETKREHVRLSGCNGIGFTTKFVLRNQSSTQTREWKINFGVEHAILETRQNWAEVDLVTLNLHLGTSH